MSWSGSIGGVLRSALWRRRDFVTFWAGQTISMFGSRVTVLALPLTAILTLRASPFQMGLLEAMGAGASLVFSLPAGVWADRVRRRPMMVAANLGQGTLLFSIPVAAWLGILSLPQLYVVAFLSASFAVFFSVARASYLPSIVPRELLVEANGTLRATGSLAQIAGPGLGGVLVQALTAPVAIAADAISFVVAGLGLIAIRTPEAAPSRAQEANIRHEVAEGIRAVLANPILRSLAGASATFNLFDSMLFTVYVLYMSRTLHLAASAIGLIFGLAGAGGLLAALLVAPLTARLGVGRAILQGILLATAGELLIAAAGGPQVVAVSVLLAAEGAVELGAGLYSINVGSLQQAVTPDRLRGRVAATNELATLGVGPAGALLGGILGEVIGLRPTVLVAGVGTLLSLLWVLWSPVRRLQEVSIGQS